MKRISVGNPEIADIVVLKSTQIYVVGKALGSTNILVMDKRDDVITSIDLEVGHDLEALKTRLYELFPNEEIEVHSSQGSIVLSGQVSNISKVAAAVELANSFLPLSRGLENTQGKEEIKGNRVINHHGFAISPSVKEGWILRTSDDLLQIMEWVTGDFPVVFPDLPKVLWQQANNSLYFSRQLPNGVKFGGSIVASSEWTVELELFIENGSAAPLTGIRLQICAYLRAIKEFADFTVTNKFVHLAEASWINFELAQRTAESGKYRLGFRGMGPAVADLPVFVTRSNVTDHLAAMTWYESSASIMSNPKHPCMHVDPVFPDLAPQQRQTILGELLFFKGSLEQFEAWFKQRRRRQNHLDR